MNDIISKIQKLLALSRSSNRAEAELAMIKANELLLKYNLSLNEVLNESESSNIGDFSYGKVFVKIKLWQLCIAQAVCKINACQIITSGEHRKKFVIVGNEVNAEAVSLMLDYLFGAIERISRRDIPKNAKAKYREDFRFGMAREIERRLFERMNSLDSESSAVIVSNSKKISDYLSGRTETITLPSVRLKDNAFSKGVKSAKNISLNEQIKDNNSVTKIERKGA